MDGHLGFIEGARIGHTRRRPAHGTPITEYTEHLFGVSNEDPPPLDINCPPWSPTGSWCSYSRRMASTDPIITVLYDADCGVCRLTMRALERLDWRRRLVVVPLQSFIPSADGDPTRRELRSVLHLRDERGSWERGGRAALRIARVIPVLAPLAVVGQAPGMQGLVDGAYALVARNRRLISRLLRIK
jgi:predicted DCC family thiol-disulfide oxidoreductase YuxK